MILTAWALSLPLLKQIYARINVEQLTIRPLYSEGLSGQIYFPLLSSIFNRSQNKKTDKHYWAGSLIQRHFTTYNLSMNKKSKLKIQIICANTTTSVSKK